MRRLLFLLALLPLFVAGRAEAAIVQLTATATYAPGADGIASLALSVAIDTDDATERDQGGFFLRGASGMVMIDGVTYAFADARIIAARRASGRDVLVLRLGDLAGRTNLRLTLVGPQDAGAAPTDMLTAVLAASGFDTLRFQAEGAPTQDSETLTATAAVPAPGALLLFATGGLALTCRRRGQARRR